MVEMSSYFPSFHFTEWMVQVLDDFGLGDLAVSRLIDYLRFVSLLLFLSVSFLIFISSLFRECLVSINPVLKQAAIGTVCAAQTHTKENLRFVREFFFEPFSFKIILNFFTFQRCHFERNEVFFGCYCGSRVQKNRKTKASPPKEICEGRRRREKRRQRRKSGC